MRGSSARPRHIIEFIVDVVDPQKSDTILDPACGTAGFLISAYKHILDANKNERPGGKLTPDERGRLLNNFKGYDISPDMVRLSLVNLYLHGFVNPQVYEYDTLSSDERWNEYADVILANPPFMSPKGGIKPHKRFSVQSSRSEVLFVDYMAEHLTPTGRAGIIVPEGIIFQSSNAYKGLRKMLVDENNLWAVVSLPAGVFNPYAGVKTSILLLDKTLAKKTDKIMFVKVEADGFDLGAQRRPNGKDDLPAALEALRDWRDQTLKVSETFRVSTEDEFDPSSYILPVTLVPKATLAESDYNLSGDRYKKNERVNDKSIPLVTLGKACERIADNIDPNQFSGSVNYIGLENIESNTGNLVGNTSSLYEDIKSAKTRFSENDILYGKLRPNLNKVYLAELSGICSTDIYVLRTKDNAHPRYLSEILRSKYFNTDVLKGLGGAQLPRVSFSYMEKLQIPLPTLDIQRTIVEEIEGYQRIIDGARQVVEGWKPNLELELDEARKSAGVDEWDVEELGNICKNLDSQRKPVTKSDRVSGPYPYYGASGIVDYVDDFIFDGDYLLISEDGANLLARVTPIAFSVSGKVWVNNHAHVLKFKNHETQKFVEIYINQIDISLYVTGAAQPKLNQKALNSISIPFPPLDVQREIVSSIEAEREVVDANLKMIEIYDAKVKRVVARVWDG